MGALEARRTPAGHSLRPEMLATALWRPRWRLAASLDALGWLLRTGALLVAPLTLVAPGMALGLLMVVLFSAVLLGERPGPHTLAGVTTLIAGVALVAVHAPAREVAAAGPVTWGLCVGLLLGGASAAFVARLAGEAVDARLIAVSAGFAWGLNAVLAKLVADSLAAGRIALMAAALAATCCVTVIAYLAKASALQAGSATVVESVTAVVTTLAPVAFAPLLFGERWPTRPGDALTLAAGVVLVAVGVWVLSRASAGVLASADLGPATDTDADVAPAARPRAAGLTPAGRPAVTP